MKNITVEMLMARAQQSNDDKIKIITHESEVLGGVITLKRPSLKKISDVLAHIESTDDLYAATMVNAEIVYESCEMLHNTALMEAYGTNDPVTMVFEMFNENVGELDQIAQKIIKAFGIVLAVDDAKN